MPLPSFGGWRRPADAGQSRHLLALAEIYDGGSRTDAARIGAVGLQTVCDWVLAFKARGPDGLIDDKAPGQAPKPMGGDHTSKRIEAHATLILATSKPKPRLFLRDRLAEQGVQTSTSGLSRFFKRHAITWKRGRRSQLSRSVKT